MRFAPLIRALEAQEAEEFNPLGSPMAPLRGRVKDFAPQGFYLCGQCQKKFSDLAAKRAHHNWCRGNSRDAR